MTRKNTFPSFKLNETIRKTYSCHASKSGKFISFEKVNSKNTFISFDVPMSMQHFSSYFQALKNCLLIVPTLLLVCLQMQRSSQNAPQRGNTFGLFGTRVGGDGWWFHPRTGNKYSHEMMLPHSTKLPTKDDLLHLHRFRLGNVESGGFEIKSLSIHIVSIILEEQLSVIQGKKRILSKIKKNCPISHNLILQNTIQPTHSRAEPSRRVQIMNWSTISKKLKVFVLLSICYQHLFLCL